MDPDYCGKHEHGFFGDECPICERGVPVLP